MHFCSLGLFFLGHYSTFLVRRSQSAVLSQKNQKTNLFEPPSLPGDQEPQKIGTVQHFCKIFQKTLGQYSTFAGFIAKMLYCPNLFLKI